MNLKSLLQQIAIKKGRHFSSPLDLEKYLQDFSNNELTNKDTLQEALDITNEDMELLYRDGYVYYQKKCFVEAAISFRFLVLFNPLIKKYWMGLGACQQARGELDKALHAYATAALLDMEDPYPHFYAYQCYLATGHHIDSMKALSLAYEKASDKPTHQSLLSRISLLMTKRHA